MEGSKSTSRTNAANNQQAIAANANAQPDGPKREPETAPVDAQTRHEMIAGAAYRHKQHARRAREFFIDMSAKCPD